MVKKVQVRCYKRGLLIWTAGHYGNVIRLLPPLVITEELLHKGLDILIEVIKEVAD
jgi:diaminobutyrate-2-oxoglutarate transaminase